MQTNAYNAHHSYDEVQNSKIRKTYSLQQNAKLPSRGVGGFQDAAADEIIVHLCGKVS